MRSRETFSNVQILEEIHLATHSAVQSLFTVGRSVIVAFILGYSLTIIFDSLPVRLVPYDLKLLFMKIKKYKQIALQAGIFTHGLTSWDHFIRRNNQRYRKVLPPRISLKGHTFN